MQGEERFLLSDVSFVKTSRVKWLSDLQQEILEREGTTAADLRNAGVSESELLHLVATGLVSIRRSIPIPENLSRRTRPTLNEFERPTVFADITETLKPVWDEVARELWVGTSLVKRFMKPSANQTLVLSTFEELGWPRAIDDPLPPKPNIDPCPRLRDTIRRLNQAQHQRILQFRSNGHADGVCWERVA